MSVAQPVVLSIGTFASTLLGGLFALRYREWLDAILGFTAGVLLGVVSFDVLPEIFATAHDKGIDPDDAMIALVLGFLLFHLAERFLHMHRHGDDEDKVPHPEVGSSRRLL